MTAEPLSEREIEELQWLLSESFIGGKLIQHPRYPQQVFPDGSSDAFCTVQVSNVECWDKRAGLIAAAINALPRLIAASRPTDRGEPVAEHLLQAYGLTTAIGRMTHSADEDAQIDPDDAQDAMDSLIGRAREIMSLPSTATAPYAQDLSEPRPAMATGHDLKDHPKWDAMSGDDRKRAVVKWLESDNPVAQMLRALRKWIDEDDQMSAGVTHQALSLAVAAIYVGAPNHGIPAPSSRLPEGWVAVPKEPTPAMVAAADELDAELRSQGFNGADVRVVYAAMLASTPSPEGA
jgi:hypothetical protein